MRLSCGLSEHDRLFGITKHYLEYEMKRGSERTGIKRIRIHDLRHGHASLLISLGTPPNLVVQRLGHEKIQTTLNTYSHLYPNQARDLAEHLEVLNMGEENEE